MFQQDIKVNDLFICTKGFSVPIISKLFYAFNRLSIMTRGMQYVDCWMCFSVFSGELFLHMFIN